MKEKIFRMIVKGLVIYCVVMAGMYVFQRKLMYFPDNSLLEPTAYGIDAQLVSVVATDKTKLTAWYMPAAEGLPTILHLHGNAGNIAYRKPSYEGYQAAGFGVLALSWRGYGTSEGDPSEEGFYSDARAAIAWLKERGIADSDIILYGESIGTGAAVQMATEITPKALVLEAPFTSLWERAAEIHFWLPVKYLVKDRYDSRSKIKQVEVPVLIFHNEGDRIVPARHGRALHELANEPKRLEMFKSNEHVDFDRTVLAQKMKEFLALE